MDALQAFFTTRLAAARHPALLLDYDGTLAPFRIERSEARPYDGVPALLDAIVRQRDTRVVIVTGRAVADVEPLLGLHERPEIWGSHGWERLDAEGRYALAPLPPAARAALDGAHDAMQRAGHADRCERKPASIALHWRGQPPSVAAALQAEARRTWQPYAAGAAGLALHAFDGGLELRASGIDKGTAVRRVLSAAPASDAAAYLGDDRTDEDAFAAIGPAGIGVLVRETPRTSAAQAWLRPPAELRAFLARWHAVRTR